MELAIFKDPTDWVHDHGDDNDDWFFARRLHTIRHQLYWFTVRRLLNLLLQRLPHCHLPAYQVAGDSEPRSL